MRFDMDVTNTTAGIAMYKRPMSFTKRVPSEQFEKARSARKDNDTYSAALTEMGMADYVLSCCNKSPASKVFIQCSETKRTMRIY